MREQTKDLLEVLARDAADWDKAAEDMDYVAPLLGDENNRRSALARAACYRKFAARDRALLNRMKQELLSRESVPALR
jgi:hypothetical protein